MRPLSASFPSVAAAPAAPAVQLRALGPTGGGRRLASTFRSPSSGAQQVSALLPVSVSAHTNSLLLADSLTAAVRTATGLADPQVMPAFETLWSRLTTPGLFFRVR